MQVMKTALVASRFLHRRIATLDIGAIIVASLGDRTYGNTYEESAVLAEKAFDMKGEAICSL